LVDNQIDQATGTVRLKATLPNQDGALWPGQFVNAQLLLRVCAVQRRRFPVGAGPTRQFAPAGSSRSSHGGNEMAEAFGMRATNW
jgi:multidrug efflux system membrane fusion protein